MKKFFFYFFHFLLVYLVSGSCGLYLYFWLSVGRPWKLLRLRKILLDIILSDFRQDKQQETLRYLLRWSKLISSFGNFYLAIKKCISFPHVVWIFLLMKSFSYDNRDKQKSEIKWVLTHWERNACCNILPFAHTWDNLSAWG